MSIDKRVGIANVESLPGDGSGMQLSQRVMERLAITERLVERGIEAIKRPHQLIRTLEVVADVRERKFHIRNRSSCTRLAADATLKRLPLAFDVTRLEHVVP
jgi:hypothetical protein